MECRRVLFRSEHEAGHLGRTAIVLRDQLVEAGAGTDLATGGDGGTREKITRLRAMDITLSRFLVVEAFDEEQLGTEIVQRREYLAEFHVLALPFRPPLLGVEAVAGEERGDAHRRLAGRAVLLGLITSDVGGLEPRQRHGHAYAS